MIDSISMFKREANGVTFTICCTTFWLCVWAYTNYRMKSFKAFSRYFPVHDFFCITYFLLASLSLYFDDETDFSERIPILFAISYFAVDIIDCIFTKDIAFLVHAILSLALNVSCLRTPLHLSLRSVSKGALIEISTPFLHKWHTSKKKIDFQVFLAVFTVSRMIWFPYFLWGTFTVGGAPKNGIIFPLCVLLFTLQFFWWFKMGNMLLNYREAPSKKES